MPGVAARFGNDIYHRTGIASVFRAELVGDKNVLVDPFDVGNKNAWSGDAVIVVILTVALLVIVATAKAVDGESCTTGEVGKVIVAAGGDAGNKQSQVVQSFILLHAGHGGEHRAAKGVGDL